MLKPYNLKPVLGNHASFISAAHIWWTQSAFI